MKTLIIYAHPDHESHAKTTLAAVEEKLKAKNSEYEILDLYKINFNPVLSYDELYEYKTKGTSIDIKNIQEKITGASQLILIYPIWWNGMPAMMKGFIDRVFNSGYAFKYVNNMPVGLLKGKNAIVFVSTGAPKLFTWIGLGNRFKKNATHDILGFCGIKTRIYHTDAAFELNDKQKEKIKNNVNNAMK